MDRSRTKLASSKKSILSAANCASPSRFSAVARQWNSNIGRLNAARTSALTIQRNTMAKEVVAQVKLQIPAGQANSAPPVGTSLALRGINSMAFAFVIPSGGEESLTLE